MLDEQQFLRRCEAIETATGETVGEAGGCSGKCWCSEPCTKVPEHKGDHYCPKHGAYA